MTDVLPEDFGAKGDGATDDTAAINAALNAARTGTVRLNAKTYCVSGPLNLQTSRLLGEHWWRSNQGGSILKVIGENVVDKVLYSQSNRCVIENVIVLANGRANHGIHLDTAHHTDLINVSVQGALHAGVRSKGSTFRMKRVSSTVNQGRGFHISDCNASQFYALTASYNALGGLYIAAENGAQASGFALRGGNFEQNGVADVWLKGINTASHVDGLHIESKTGADTFVLEDCRHVLMLGGRLSGAGAGGRGLRLLGEVQGCDFIGVRVVSGTGHRSYETVTIPTTCHGNFFQRCLRMTQGAAPEPLVWEDFGINNQRVAC